MKSATIYECPTCQKHYTIKKEAEECKNKHQVLERVTIYCHCGTGFYSWNCGGIENTIKMINQHQARNCDIVERKSEKK